MVGRGYGCRKGLANRNALARCLGNRNDANTSSDKSDKSDRSDKTEFVGVGGVDVEEDVEEGGPVIRRLFVRLG